MSALREIEVVLPGGETRRFGELAQVEVAR